MNARVIGSGCEKDIFHDPRLRSVEWQDLVTRHAPGDPRGVAAARHMAGNIDGRGGERPLRFRAPAVFMFFLAGLRLVENAFHSALGLPARVTRAVLWIMSLVTLGSIHAVRFNHLRHHRLKLGDGEVEGRSAEMPALVSTQGILHCDLL